MLTKALVVGAGAVGQVIGRALARGGAAVTFLVKPSHEGDARRGFVLYPLSESRGAQPVEFHDFRVVVAPEPGHDVVILTVSSTALRAPGFVADLATRVGDATVVSLQPAIEDAELVLEHVPAERVVHGLIGFLAFATPLPGDSSPRGAGVASWFPPFSATLLSGPRALPLVRALRAGRLSSRLVRDAVTSRSLGGAVLETVVTALEAAGWDHRVLARDRALRLLAVQAAREAVTIAARRRAVPEPWLLHVLGPKTLRFGLAAFARLAPFDISTFFRVHYAKIAGQHRLMAAEARAQARALAIPTPALDALAAVTAPGVERPEPPVTT